MRHPYRTVSLAIIAVLLSSCSFQYYFHLFITVTNEETGQPVEGVAGRIDTYVVNDSEKDLDFGDDIGVTGANGQIDREFIISGGSRTRPWLLKLKKEGYEPLVIDIKLESMAEPGAKHKQPLPVEVKMKALKKP